MEKDTPCNGNQNKARVAILISDKLEYKINTVTRHKEGQYKWSREQSKKKTQQL